MHSERERKELYAVRDLFLGQNYVRQNVELGLALAASCSHPEAVWIYTTFADKEVRTAQQAVDVLQQLGQDPRALCYLGILKNGGIDVSLIAQSAALKYSYAYVYMAIMTRGVERFKWAKLAADAGERGGYAWMGWCFEQGVGGCPVDLKSAKQWLCMAAEEDLVLSMTSYAKLLAKTDPKRYEWLGKAASRGCFDEFIEELDEQMRLFNFDEARPDVVFALGKSLRGHVDAMQQQLFHLRASEDDVWDEIDPGRHERCVGFATQAVQFYEDTLLAARKAVDAWTLVGLRNKVVKDIRKKVAEIIWSGRFEANYDVMDT